MPLVPLVPGHRLPGDADRRQRQQAAAVVHQGSETAQSPAERTGTDPNVDRLSRAADVRTSSVKTHESTQLRFWCRPQHIQNSSIKTLNTHFIRSSDL